MSTYNVKVAYQQEVRGQKSSSTKTVSIVANRANFLSEGDFKRHLEKEAMFLIEGCTKATWQGHSQV